MKKFFLFFILSCLIGNFSFAETKEWGTVVTNKKQVKDKTKKPFKILTFDGGGIRGAYTAQILAMLEEEVHFLQYVDLFAGTSTGTILAFGLAYGLTPEELVNLYKTKAHEIFKEKRSFLEVLQLSAKYQTDSLKKVLHEVIPADFTLNQLEKKVLCVSFNLFNPYYNNWTPAVMDNFDPQVSDKINVVDAILMSTAAPTYFASYQGHIDGGVVANNPSMMALASALDGNKGNQEISNIRLLSMGTGLSTSNIPNDVDWGTIEWMIKPPFYSSTPLFPMIDLLLDGTISGPHYQCSCLLGSAYFRINTYLSNNIALDDWKQVDVLIEEAKNIPLNDPDEWSEMINWIKENFIPKDAKLSR